MMELPTTCVPMVTLGWPQLANQRFALEKLPSATRPAVPVQCHYEYLSCVMERQNGQHTGLTDLALTSQGEEEARDVGRS